MLQFKPISVFITGAAAGIGIYTLTKLLFNPTKNADQKSNGETNEIPQFDENKKLSVIYVIRKDLKMRPGKISAQVGHASLGIFLKIANRIPHLADYDFQKELFYCPNEAIQTEKKNLAKDNNLSHITIHDAGRTQIAAGSATVLAFGPVESDAVSVFTEGLTPIPK
ncbi:Peptidyl-tRNA hydrolase 2, mitochondrial [Tritrichomonas foetus]|uniref:peptidyl-tRNA hydrolase n=1 Tax=Tritrichomonas foetus TaxID=1144522 RepID=A0A1J4KK78_9EUKA|nr:Peptidyl-tRNA hydrolase 2, mitochondrial [Tritrichomonas foetus]|eukprot:OHT11703.1 Peptidyl-tRNA hydrolase 2, mitochondrial [Tritrichomonas foetus]